MRITALIPFVAAAACAFATVFVGATPVAAQDRFDVQNFNPAPTQRSNALGVWQARVLPDSAFEIGALFHYSDDPLVLRDPSGDRLRSIVGSQANLHIMGGFGLFDLLEISADIPLVVLQTGETIGSLPNFAVGAPDAGFGVGDIRLVGKLQLFNSHTEQSPGGGAIALVVQGFLPSGKVENYQGGEARFNSTLVFDGVSPVGHRFSFNFGYTVRANTRIRDLHINDTFNWGIAADFLAHEKVSVLLEARGALSVLADGIGPEESPIEANMALRVRPVDMIQFEFGGGVGLFQGFGVPDWRIMAGLSYYRHPPQDRDGDGIVNADDQCPDNPEDFDDFEDENGCPDEDNDQDGILDEPDQCPLEPEDIDRFEDENGCPDPDNDQDGILDEPDECLNAPEDIDNFEDEDGCPDPDNDRDGILDEPDECPLEPEDIDEFEDENGCPDPDNDGDGILDEPDQCPNTPEDMNGVHDDDGCPEVDTDGDGILDPLDQCPNDPEDKDNFEDENGCPDPDNDQDTILDTVDRCPNEPENMNGNEDEDGCPDEDLVVVTCDHIVINDKIHFETNRAIIRSESYGLLDQVANVLRSRADIQGVRVEGHTDSRGSDRHNLRLSDARAHSVRTYLIERGQVQSSRLEAQGFGEQRPIESNSTRSGRAANRRVEFVITGIEGCDDSTPSP